jgi:hypothetical protein
MSDNTALIQDLFGSIAQEGWSTKFNDNWLMTSYGPSLLKTDASVIGVVTELKSARRADFVGAFSVSVARLLGKIRLEAYRPWLADEVEPISAPRAKKTPTESVQGMLCRRNFYVAFGTFVGI